MKILVTGAKGTLGADIVKVFRSAGHDVCETDRSELDITNAGEVLDFFMKEKPLLVINTAAYNAVDAAEEKDGYEKAYAVNAIGPKNLAEAAKAVGATFVHYSTDYVFAGDKPEGYGETDATSPISAYGKTKVEGERFVQEVGGRFYIARLSKIFGTPGVSEFSKESFVHLMLRLAKEKSELNIVHEEVGCPTYTKDIAEATLLMLQSPPGFYHLVNSGEGVTWYEFANEIFTLADVEIPRNPVSSDQFPKPAKRPKFARLLNTKLPPLRSRTEALKEFLESEGLFTKR